MRESAPQFLARLTAAFETLPPEPWRHARAKDPARLAFVLGFPRSGTTLLGQILASRPDVALLEEKPLLASAIAGFATDPDGPAKLAAATDAEIERHRRDFWQRVGRCGVDPAGKLLVDQTALNTVHLPLIRRLFPEAAIVFALRDPRDVVFSCFRRLFSPNLFTLEFHALDSAARLYDAAMTLAEIGRRRLGVEALDMRNEALVEDFDGETKRLCGYLNLDWNDSMREFQTATQARTLVTRSATQVRRGLNKDGIGVWRRYRDEMAPVLPLLEPWVERFGYGFAGGAAR
jgi:hypothetical protein